MGYLALLDAAGIQDYVFRSPELKNIADASRKIEDLTKPDGLFRNGLFRKKAEAVGAKVVWAAGGNAALLADDAEILKTSIRSISRALLEEGAGLEIVSALVSYKPGELAESYQRALRELERRKLTQARNVNFTFAGLGEPYPEKDAESLSNSEESDLLIEPRETDNLICESTEETGLIAVVSVDGIGMGGKLKDWLDSRRDISDDEFIQEFFDLSESLKTRWSDAWKRSTERVLQAFSLEDYALSHPLPNRAIKFRRVTPKDRESFHLRAAPIGARFLPYRHIYHGGDDLIFVCDARIALGLTALLLRHLESAPVAHGVPEQFHTITANAGIVFTDSHFPFIRAVQLAVEAGKGAKKKARESMEETRAAVAPSALNWWVNRRGAVESPESPFDGATLKPYLLRADADTFGELDWAAFETQMLGGLWDAFRDARNKLKDLAEAAERGQEGESVRRLLSLRPLDNGKRLDFLPAPFQKESGFHQNKTPLLDAVELYDIHYPLPSAEEEAQT